MISAVSLDFKPNYTSSVSYEYGMMKQTASPTQSGSSSSYEETDEESSISSVTPTASSSSFKTIKIGAGISTKPKTDEGTTSTSTQTTKAASNDTSTATTPNKTTKTATTKTNKAGLGSGKVIVEPAKAVATATATTTADNSALLSFKWSKAIRSQLVKTSLTVNEMKALKEIYSESGNYSGSRGAQALVEALKKKGITNVSIANDGYSIMFGDRKVSGNKNSGSTDFIKIMVKSDGFQNAYNKNT